MAQDYTVEQLNYGRKVYDFMRWDYVAFGVSLLLLVASIVVMSTKGFNWGLDFTGGTVIEINLENPADLDQLRDTLQNAGLNRRYCKTLVALVMSWYVCHLQPALPARSWVTKSSRLSMNLLIRMHQ